MKAVPWLAARDGQHEGWSTALPPLQQEERSAQSQVIPLICQGLIGVGPPSPSF